MEIEINSVYRAANGAKVTITYELFQEQYDFMARAEYKDASSRSIDRIETMPLQYYRRNGISNRGDRGWDIIACWNNSNLLPTISFQEESFKGSVLEKHIALGNKNIWLSHKHGCEMVLEIKKSQFFQDALVLINKKIKSAQA